MIWLLESEVFDGDLNSFIETLERFGESYSVIKFGIPYEEYIKSHEDHNVVVLSSFQFAKLSKTTKWQGVFCNFPEFECLYYYPRFEKYLFNQDYRMFPFGAIDENLLSGVCFLKPSSFKLFNGQVVTPENWKIKKNGLRANLEDLVVLAPCKRIDKEWRTVVFKNKVITACQYKDKDKNVRVKDVPKKVFEYGNMVLNEVNYNPDPIWVMDICEDMDENLHILEVGPFSCCGLYCCDAQSIIDAVHDIAVDW